MPLLCASPSIPQTHPLVASATLTGASEPCGMPELRVCMADEETGAQRGHAAGPKQIKCGAEVASHVTSFRFYMGVISHFVSTKEKCEKLNSCPILILET